jgi:murein DD-endopeptidase MepM/ murein hydrolase activator NlpD
MAMDQKNQSYTIMILPNPASKTYRFSVSKKALKIAAGSTAFLTVLMVVFLVQYALMMNRMWELNSLRQETKTQKVQIQTFAQTIEEIKQQMTRLREFDAKLRVITDIGLPKERTQLIGMGGTQEPALEDYLNSPVPAESGLQKELLHGMKRDLSYLQNAATQQEVSFQELVSAVKNKQSMWASTPSVWPVRGWLTSGFGNRVSPFTGGVMLHNGIDIATRMETPIMAPAAGIVSYAGYDNGLGKLLKINHGYGIQTVYGHLSRFSTQPGHRVKRGEVVAYVGNTGLSTGPHLHYEVLVNNIPVNPMKYILN